jgi:hypothetical protein
MNIMKQRRAQFYAPAIKKLDVVQKEIDKKYEEYVFAKRKIRIDPKFEKDYLHGIDKLKKSLRYRPASTDPILR